MKIFCVRIGNSENGADRFLLQPPEKNRYDLLYNQKSVLL